MSVRLVKYIICAVSVTLCLFLMVSSDHLKFGATFDGTENIFRSFAKKDQKTFNFLERERQKTAQNLNDIDYVKQFNSDPLPNRKSNVTARQMCTNISDPTACMPKFKMLETRLRIAPKYKMMNCIVQKSMSTLMTAIFCFLYNEKGFRESNRGFYMEWSKYRLCRDKNEYNDVNAIRKKFRIKRNDNSWSFTMLTRDPVERFISGYVDKCIRKPWGKKPCNGCGHNMTCFIETEYTNIRSQVKSKHMARTFEDRHFFPQNWRCNLRTEYKHYKFIKYSSSNIDDFLIPFKEISKKQNVSQSSLNFLEHQLKQGRTVHSTVDSPSRTYLENRLRSSPYLMEIIVKIFYYDFLLFDYEFPPGF